VEKPEGDRPPVRIWVSNRSPSPSHSPRPLPVAPEEEGDELLEDLPEEPPPIRILAFPRLPQAGIIPFFLGMMLLWSSLAGLAIGGGWVAIQFILNPGSVRWMAWMLPASSRLPLTEVNAPQSLPEIQAQATAAGLVVGHPMPLGNTGDLVFPVGAQMPCSEDVAIATGSTCGVIAELRVYRPHQTQHTTIFQLVDRLAIPGMQESAILAPLATSLDNDGSSQFMPFTTLTQIDGASPAGAWFQLTGTWVRGSTQILYGQVMTYTPGQGRLVTRLRWSSPAQALPIWKPVTGGGSPELLVDQTLGLEPKFQVYRVKSTSDPATPAQLEAIALTKPALSQWDYKQGLLLANHGLWTPALDWLQHLKNRYQGKAPGWTSAAQAQLDVIQLHAKFTQLQVTKNWASPVQGITALLINGQWQKALHALKVALGQDDDLTVLLKDDSGLIWQRVEGALSVNPNALEVQTWGALIVATRQGKRAAIAWLQAQQPKSLTAATPSTATDRRYQDLLNLLNSLSLPQTSMTSDSRWLGNVTVLPHINPTQWTVTQSNTHLQLNPGQVWYQIQVIRFYDGQRWWQSPFTRLPLPSLGVGNELWDAMGLGNDPNLQIVLWTADRQSQTLSATVKAIQFRNGTLSLLAAGDALSSEQSNLLSHPLAMAEHTLHWLEATRTMTLNDLYQQYPTWGAALLPNLWHTVQPNQSGETTPEGILAEIGSWSVELLDLNGNQAPEAMLTLNPIPSSSGEPNPVSDRPASFQRLIFSDQGNLIYRDQSNAGETLTAIANFEDYEFPVLVIDTPQTYILKQWSSLCHCFKGY